MFSNKINDEERSDRVIATKWDAAFVLHDGIPTKKDLERLSYNVPKQEIGRLSYKELTLSRANRSVRIFDHVVESLSNGIQPDKKNILVAPSSSGPTTMWNISYFIDLMKRLDNKLDCFFVIAVDSSEKEKKIASEITRSFNKNKIMILSDKTINQAMPIISCCNLSICNDTSFQHLSCQLNVPTLILRFDTPAAYSSYSKLQYPILPEGYTEINHDTRADPTLINVEKVLAKTLSLLN